jgi:hypothetical protein
MTMVQVRLCFKFRGKAYIIPIDDQYEIEPVRDVVNKTIVLLEGVDGGCLSCETVCMMWLRGLERTWEGIEELVQQRSSLTRDADIQTLQAHLYGMHCAWYLINNFHPHLGL